MRRLISLLPMLLLGGCGTFADPTEWFGGPEVVEPSPLVELQNPAQPQTLWSRDVGVGTDGQRLSLEPQVLGDTVYVADAEGQVQALAVQDGATRWRVDLDLPVAGGPGVGEGLVLVGTSNGEVVALSAASGEERWRTRVSSEVLSVPAAGYGVAIVRTIDGKLFGLEATNGKERWRYEREVPTLTLRGTGSPVLSAGVVYAGLAGGKLVALRADNGNLIWDVSVTVPGGRSELQRLADIDGDPLVLGGGVFVATYQGEVAAVEQRSGRVAWRRSMSAYSRMAADPAGGLYVSDADGVVWGLDIRSGTVRWSQEALKHRRLSSVAVVGDLVVVGDFQGYLHWLDRGDGSLVARTRVGSEPITDGLRVVDGVLYVLGDGGELAALRPPARG
jgi:outer membrane protein assembly factor BamB